MSINMNDFGGKNEHLMNHRYFNNRDRKYQIDWKYWAKQVKKDETWNSLKEYILDKQPDLLVIEEMLISCYESIDFIGELLFWKSQGWYERAKIDRMLDDFEKFYAEIEEI